MDHPQQQQPSPQTTQQDGGKEREVSKLTSGSYFGELALITHKPRAANVYADTDVKVACEYYTFHFTALVDVCPVFASREKRSERWKKQKQQHEFLSR